MKVYLDFDGVILDTDSVFDLECVGDRREFVRNYDWFKLMRNDLAINNSIDFILNSKYDTCLLSKISSMCEGQAKIKFLREKGIGININLVPTGIDKNSVVDSKGNVLIDDKIYNLDKWTESGGIGIFFNKDLSDTDMYGKKNIRYKVINNLSCLVDGIDDLI